MTSKTQIVIALRVLALFLACHLRVCAQASEETNKNDSVLLFSQYQWPQGAGPLPIITYFYADLEQLRMSPAWDPDAEQFPLRLSDEANRAARALSTEAGVSNKLTLVRVWIFRTRPASLSSEDDKTGLGTNRWAVFFEYGQSRPELPIKHRLVLLNGTWATERGPDKHELSAASARVGRPSQNSPFGGLLKQTTGQGNSEVDPLERIKHPDFKISGVQWNPDEGDFPSELSSLAASAREYLSSRHLEATGACTLLEIDIHTHMPREAIHAQGLDILHNLNHWVISFLFEWNDGTTVRQTGVYVLLDGRVFGARDF